MTTLSPQLRIAHTAAVLDGPYGSVTRYAQRAGLSRQALYRDATTVLQAVEGAEYRRQLQELLDGNDRLRADRALLQQQLQQAVVLDADSLACFAAKAQAEGVTDCCAKN